jgi:hypothetical protein
MGMVRNIVTTLEDCYKVVELGTASCIDLLKCFF